MIWIFTFYTVSDSVSANKVSSYISIHTISLCYLSVFSLSSFLFPPQTYFITQNRLKIQLPPLSFPSLVGEASQRYNSSDCCNNKEKALVLKWHQLGLSHSDWKFRKNYLVPQFPKSLFGVKLLRRAIRSASNWFTVSER